MTTSLVEATGFEPAASASRTQRSTKLSHASTVLNIILIHSVFVKIKRCLHPRSGQIKHT